MPDGAKGDPEEEPKSDPEGQGDEPKTYEVDGQELTADELFDKHKNLQSGFTKTTMELSEIKKAKEQPPEEPDEASIVAEAISPHVDKKIQEKLDARFDQESRKRQIRALAAANPALNRKALEGLAQSEPGKPLEEIIESYGLNGDKRLEKVRGGGDPLGEPRMVKKPEAPISPVDMNDEQFDKFEQKIGVTGKTPLKKAKKNG